MGIELFYVRGLGCVKLVFLLPSSQEQVLGGLGKEWCCCCFVGDWGGDVLRVGEELVLAGFPKDFLLAQLCVVLLGIE